MTSSTATQGQTSQVKRTSFSSFASGGASMFLDRSKPGIRGSTPDSEALASSDDEQDHHHRLHPVTSNPAPRPNRRPSWLPDAPQAPIRKGSLGANGPFSPVSPSSVTPTSDQNPWAGNHNSNLVTGVGRGHSSNTSFPWASTIWNNDPQKGPPQRLTEVLPSPTSMVPPGSGSLVTDEPLRSPLAGQDNLAESAIPFAIPLQPTPKTYRSQSYSVGQLDPESSNQIPGAYGGYNQYGRSRNGMSYTGLQHRPSRPSMLGDLPHDSKLLSQLREVEDDEESMNDSDPDAESTAKSQARTIEQLAIENAMLRQAAAEQLERETARHRDRGTTSNLGKFPRAIAKDNQQLLPNSVLEKADYVSYDAEDSDARHLYKHENLNGRRSSEYSTKPFTSHMVSGVHDSRFAEGVKKGHWQTSLGFGGIGEPPQSRRHSFADVPTRQNSIGSDSDHHDQSNLANPGLRSEARQVPLEGYVDSIIRPHEGNGSEYILFHTSLNPEEEQNKGHDHLLNPMFAVAYLSRTDSSLLQRSEARENPAQSTSLHQAYVQNQYGRSPHPGHNSRSNQALFMVTFKAQRADVFYVHDNSGLQVRKGDLVIVEADRGADIGTVASEGVPFSEAKELKEKFMQEHYQWLMVFSRHGQNGTVAGPNPNGQPHGLNGAAGALGASAGQHNGQDIPSTELKPKMIKRLAQPHEIQTLRDKEGNEAKAKRVCQQKVVEHRLHMEILEAEFQMDWKKLTFYYFADEYINFNSLVTDLFKIYKTRIWMSAINPASFQTPVGGLQIPGGSGAPVQVGLNNETSQYANRRVPRQQLIPGSGIQSQSAMNRFDHTWNQNRDGNIVNNVAFQQLYTQPYLRQELDVRQADQYPPEYRQGVPQAISMHSPFSVSNFAAPSLHHASSFTSRPDSSNGAAQSSQVLGRDWSQAMHGLSLDP